MNQPPFVRALPALRATVPPRLALASGASGIVAAVLLSAGSALGQGFSGRYPPQLGPCISERESALINARLPMYQARHGPLSPPDSDGPILYPFDPQGGTLYRDLTTGNFVDLDPAPNSVLNYLCETYGNDGHQGCDTGGLCWDEMAIGMPIFAALDGTVIDAHDGDPDMNTSCEAGGNYVIIDHGGGRICWYFHMKRSSVAVSIGQPVVAGQQLGLVGSSGCSFGPHLHFQSMQANAVYEPFAGPCRAGPSGWVHQIDPPAATFLRDFGVTSQDLSTFPGPPARFPVSPQIAFTDGNLNYWAQLCNLPANSTWTEHYIRPDGSLEYSLGPFSFGNPTTYQFSQYWFNRNVAGMHSIAGTWRIQFDVNGARVIDAPVEVVPAITAGFNRPPLPISASFDPVAPAPGDVLFCRITGPSGIRDLDWDLVRYHYVWRVNGAVVRDIVAPGMADALPRTAVTPGSILQCTITPNDGHVDGTPVSLSVAVGCYANCDASTTTPRLNVLDFSCFLNHFAAGDPYANCDASTTPPVLNVLDFSCFLNKFAAGCP